MNEFAYDDERLLRTIDEKPDDCSSQWLESQWCPELQDPELELGEEPADSENATRPWALVLDGGDLRDVERMLERMGTPSVRLTSGVPTGDDVPRRLLVTSGHRVAP